MSLLIDNIFISKIATKYNILFSKKVRKRLQEHNWLYFRNKDTNPPQVYRRLRQSASKEINDLALLACRLPDDKLNEIFNEKTLKPLLNSILFIDKSEDPIKIRNPNLRLASYMVEEGVRYCLSEFRKQNKNTPESSKPTIEYLERAVLICKEIGRQHQQEYVKKKAVEMKNRLICIWEQMFAFDYSNFEQYIYEEMKLHAPDLGIKSVETKKINEFRYILWTSGDQPDGFYFLGEIKIIFSLGGIEDGLLDNNEGRMIFYDEQGNEIKSKKVRIKKFGAEHALFEVK